MWLECVLALEGRNSNVPKICRPTACRLVLVSHVRQWLLASQNASAVSARLPLCPVHAKTHPYGLYAQLRTLLYK